MVNATADLPTPAVQCVSKQVDPPPVRRLITRLKLILVPFKYLGTDINGSQELYSGLRDETASARLIREHHNS